MKMIVGKSLVDMISEECGRNFFKNYESSIDYMSNEEERNIFLQGVCGNWNVEQ